MAYFPMFVDLKDESCVVIGGGKVAYRKVEALLLFGAKVTVVSLEFCAELIKIKSQIILKQKEYDKKDIYGAFLVIAATNNQSLNHMISIECKQKKIPVNVVDMQKECSFIFPAFLKNGPITVGITSSGNSPVISQKIKHKVNELIPDYYGELTKSLGNIRDEVKNRVDTEKERKKVYQQLVHIGEERNGIVDSSDLELVLKEKEEKENRDQGNEETIDAFYRTKNEKGMI